MSDKKRAPKKVAIDYNNGKIYKLVNDVNDMVYIGSSTTTLSRRFSTHKAHAKVDTTNIYTAMREVGVDHFQIILIELFPCTCKSELEAREYAVMHNFPQDKLYNSIRDGKYSAEAKEKMRANSARHFKGKKDEEAPNFKRGSITTDRYGFRFQWSVAGKNHLKSLSFGKKRTREMAYLGMLALREKIFPLTNQDYLHELPFAE